MSMRKLLILTTFFGMAPIVLLLLIFTYLVVLYHSHTNPATTAYLPPSQTVSYAALPTTDTQYDGDVVSSDARSEMVRQFFEKYKSPLEPYADEVVNQADAYNLDFRLIPAIAMQESNLCKRIPAGSHNCWGFGIYGSKITRFEDYPTAIETVTKTLATKYKENGLDTPELIMQRYTPSSNGSWAHGVNYFLDQLQ
jgi:hypothetical protein